MNTPQPAQRVLRSVDVASGVGQWVVGYPGMGSGMGTVVVGTVPGTGYGSSIEASMASKASIEASMASKASIEASRPNTAIIEASRPNTAIIEANKAK